MNPWSLTTREQQILTAVARLGGSKVVARELGLSHRTVEVYLGNARKKMGAAHTIIAAVKWDRYVSPRSAEHDLPE